MAQVDPPPGLLPARLVLEHLERIRLAEAVSSGGPRPVDLDIPVVPLARQNAVCLESKRKDGVRGGISRLAQKRGVVPGLARDLAAFAVGPLGDDVGQDRPDVLGDPACPQRNDADVRAQVAHDAVPAVEFERAFPVDGFIGVQIAAVQVAGVDLDDPAEGPLLDHPPDSLGRREEDPLRRTPHEAVRMLLDGNQDRGVGRQVDAEGFLAHQVFARLDRGEVELLVQIVRHRHVDRLDLVVGQEFAIVARHLSERRDVVAEPVHLGRAQRAVADRDDLGPYRHLRQMQPTGRRAGEFPTHHTAPNDPEPNRPHPRTSRPFARITSNLSQPDLTAAGSVRQS